MAEKNDAGTGRDGGDSGRLARRTVLRGGVAGLAAAGLGVAASPAAADGEEEESEDGGNGEGGDRRATPEQGAGVLRVVLAASEATYQVEASNGVEYDEDAGENDRRVDDNAIEGTPVGVPGEAFDQFRVDGDVTVTVTGGAVAFALVRTDEQEADSDGLPNMVIITGTGETVRYQFSVTGTAEKGPLAEDNASSIPADEVVDRSSVEGFVRADIIDGDPQSDDFRYSGAIQFERAEAPVQVRLEQNATA